MGLCMLICRKRASCCPIFLFARMPTPNDGSHSTFSSNAISVPGSRQTATCGSPTAAKPRVMELLNLVVTSLSRLTVKVGTTVTWRNEDDIPHTVTSTTQLFKSKALDTDDSFSFTFTEPGTYEHFCSLHPRMTATIVVEPGNVAK